MRTPAGQVQPAVCSCDFPKLLAEAIGQTSRMKFLNIGVSLLARIRYLSPLSTSAVYA
jgi:hypothetical protein